MVDRLLVARHAETRCAVEGVLNGDPRLPCPLTARGRKQAEELGVGLAAVSLDLCITTEFERTRSTADIALGQRDIPLVVQPLLNDPPLGELEGSSIESLRNWMERHDWTESPASGESQLDSLCRYTTGWRWVVERPQACVLVLAHAFTISFVRTLESREQPAIRPRYEREIHLAELFELDVAGVRTGLDDAAATLISLGHRPAPLPAGLESGRH